MNRKVKEVLTSVLERFRDGDIPEAQAMHDAPDIMMWRHEFMAPHIIRLFG